MSRKVLLNLILICILLCIYPLLWVFNQRINYRKVLTLNTKFSLNANQLPLDQISSTTYILRYFNKNNLPTTLSPNVTNPPNFNVSGRVLVTKFGTVEVFEYESHNDALKIKGFKLCKKKS